MNSIEYDLAIVALIFIAAGGPLGVALLVNLLLDRRFRRK